MFPAKEDIIRFIQNSADAGVRHLIFSGLGEPTLDPHFEEYLSIANDLVFNRICLFTNGHALTPEKASRWKDLGLSDVLLSIHGMEQAHNRNVQRRGAFSEAISALDLYTDLGLSVTINTCLTRLNLEEIPQLRAFLVQYPVKMHTLSFPEWSGNAEFYTGYMADYEEIAVVAEKLIPPEDTITFFDNIPYCMVRKKTREMQGIGTARLLDGSGDREFNPINGKLFPESCSKRACPLLPNCPGFDRNYIASRSWRLIVDRVNRFLDISHDTTVQDEILANCSIRPRQQTLDNGKQQKRKYYHQDYLVMVVKPTIRCNAGCLYCSSHKASSTPDLKPYLLRRLYAELFAYAKFVGIRRITFLWHGGEPLLLGKPFYANAWEESSKQKGFTIRHLIQTNLLLLDREWVELLRHFDVHVSTSVDPIGQERVYKDGRQQYPDWLEKFILACKGKLHLGIVFTITSRHRDRVSDIYNFFKNLQVFSPKPVSVRFNPVYAAGSAVSSLDPAQIIKPAEFGEFLYGLWELWNRDGRPFVISPLQEWSERKGLSCEFSGCCHEHFISMDSTGDIYHCGRFADTGSAWGNILTKKLTSILQHPQRLNICQRAAILQAGRCKECPFWEYCKGGCPYQAFIQFGDAAQASPFCQGYKIFFQKSSLNMPSTLEKEAVNV